MYLYNSMYNDRMIDIPYPLYESAQGKYFEAYAPDLTYGNGTSAWASYEYVFLVVLINGGFHTS
ncbi:hypothetical protein LGL55_21560 [Clostridium tagluense]|uniref:hypothetical protein n=1 Tax=Clostridium tagluense TaxID=360422 RepID=UPI001CF3C8A3|nr:hypothetical protein [Clostridium tagluense]MCB2313685.1 hypothetical protein [Clostridium tagluense]MCB2318535.1 hypothetical protein [Clostridium tagluense]MCB2323347.1 hypothetical protein [Clostridium tagluense]MCB2328360.1 hypothetical protein [Clostridium tagluense]MCB2333178.1 hypothetical protein [Clostridium tagluense]